VNTFNSIFRPVVYCSNFIASICLNLTRRFVLLCCILAFANSSISIAQADGAIEKLKIQQGKKIYREGVLPSGDFVTAVAEADIELNGSLVACANCHRYSGMGTNEGQTVIVPVTKEFLFQPKTLGRKGQAVYATEGKGTRPAYETETLIRAIREGVDPAGHVFDRLMPHFNLSDNDADALVAYLKTLHSSGSPGVDETHIHFATIITEGIDDNSKKAMIDVLETFFKEKNAGTRLETRRSENAPWHRDWKYQSYRKWALHQWELKGAAETWPAQLEEYYRQQPVFAILNGLADGSWEPMHQFCEQHELPCLFPNTDEPIVSESDYYTIYFSQGMTLEADVLGKYLNAQKDTAAPRKIVQLYRMGEKGEIAAQRMKQNFTAKNSVELINIPLQINTVPDKKFWQTLFHKNPDTDFVLWLGTKDIESISQLKISDKTPSRLFVSSTLLPKWNTVMPVLLKTKVHAVHPYQKPSAMSMHLLRVNAWLKGRKIINKQQKIQANAYFTVRAVGRAIMHLRDKFSREYFIELVEHVTEKMFVSSVYPRLTLAPGQRYASKGGYILKITDKKGQSVAPVSEWLVP